MSYTSHLTRCANCGRTRDDDPEIHFVSREYRDVCPTDRGDEIREGIEYICLDCAEESHVEA